MTQKWKFTKSVEKVENFTKKWRISRESVENKAKQGHNGSKLAKTGPKLAKWVQIWSVRGGTLSSGCGGCPDPYHGVGVTNAPCPGTHYSGYPPLHRGLLEDRELLHRSVSEARAVFTRLLLDTVRTQLRQHRAVPRLIIPGLIIPDY